MVWAFRCVDVKLLPEMVDMRGFMYPVLGLSGSDGVAGTLVHVEPSPKQNTRHLELYSTDQQLIMHFPSMSNNVSAALGRA